MRNQKFILWVVLASQILTVSLGFANECRQFYDTHAPALRPSVSEQIAARLKAEPHSYHELLVSDVLSSELVELRNEYSGILEILSTKGKTNPITWVLESTGNTLAELGRISKSLDLELGKDKHRDENAIITLSRDLQRCSQNVMTCKENLPQAIAEAGQKINKATKLISQLNERANDVETILNSPDGMQSIPLEMHSSVKMALDSHRHLIANYILQIDSALKNFKQFETTLRMFAPELTAAEYEIAILQSKGAHIDDALALAPNSSSNSKSAHRLTTGYSNFAKLFEQPGKKTAFGEMVAVGWTLEKLKKNFDASKTYVLYKILQDMKVIKNLEPNLEDGAQASEVKKFILEILRDPNLMATLKEKRIFANTELYMTYTFKQKPELKAFNFNYIKKQELHLILMLIKGNGPQLFHENLIWLAETIESVKDEIEKAPRLGSRYFSMLFSRNHRLHIQALEEAARDYREAAAEENFMYHRASLLEYKDLEVSEVYTSWPNESVLVFSR
ncbi:MAG: hypothetical protein JNL11_08005 [Bdellovibrionaceae bacterium]|nr:hypothetical protein [Pseudobdellovibrionaceae bacterium]